MVPSTTSTTLRKLMSTYSFSAYKRTNALTRVNFNTVDREIGCKKGKSFLKRHSYDGEWVFESIVYWLQLNNNTMVRSRTPSRYNTTFLSSFELISLITPT